jgi:hypothetical protein
MPLFCYLINFCIANNETQLTLCYEQVLHARMAEPPCDAGAELQKILESILVIK